MGKGGARCSKQLYVPVSSEEPSEQVDFDVVEGDAKDIKDERPVLLEHPSQTALNAGQGSSSFAGFFGQFREWFSSLGAFGPLLLVVFIAALATVIIVFGFKHDDVVPIDISVKKDLDINGELSMHKNSVGQGVGNFRFSLPKSKKKKSRPLMAPAKGHAPPSCGYLGSGYDVLFANPVGTTNGGIDEGYRSAVVHLDFDDAPRCPHLKEYLCPDKQAEFKKIKRCVIDHKATKISNLKTYTRLLERNVHFLTQEMAGQTAETVAFHASRAFNQVKVLLDDKSTNFFEVQVACHSFEGSLLSSARLQFTPAFKKDMEALPQKFPPCLQGGEHLHKLHTEDIQSWEDVRTKVEDAMKTCPADHVAYIKFLMDYGTHFTNKVIFGAAETLLISLSPEQQQLMRKQGMDVEKRLVGELGIKKVKEPTSVVMANFVEKKWVGEDLPEDGSLDEYLELAVDEPVPTEMELLPLHTVLPEPMKTNFQHAVLTWMAMADIKPGAMGAVESHIGNLNPESVAVYQASTWVGRGPIRDLLHNPGWNTVATGIHSITAGWHSAPALVLVDISRTHVEPESVNTEFRVACSADSVGRTFGTTGPSSADRFHGIHFHDVLELPDWPKVRFRLEARLLSTHKQEGPITRLDETGGEFARLSFPEGEHGKQYRRMTALHVPRAALFSQHWDNVWCTMHEKKWSRLQPPMLLENVKCHPGHKLLIFGHISRIEQMGGPTENFGLRMLYNDQHLAVHFTGIIRHRKFMEISMHAVVNCLDSTGHDKIEIEAFSDQMIVFPNTHAGEQTRRLSAIAVSYHHIVHKKWTVHVHEVAESEDWSALPTPMSMTLTTTMEGQSVLVVADISQVQCSTGAEFRILLNDVEIGYALVDSDSKLHAKGLSFHGMAVGLPKAQHTIQVQAKGSDTGCTPEYPSSTYHGAVSQQRRLTGIILEGSEMNTHQGSDDLALKMPSMQSSTDGGMVASRANDGLTAPWPFANSVAKTDKDSLSWWQVDLERNHVIARVVVVPAHGHPLHKIMVYIKDTDGQLKFNTTTLAQERIGTTKHLMTEVPQAIGRYVKVMVEDSSLALAEVMVYPPS